jgi:bacterioferritin
LAAEVNLSPHMRTGKRLRLPPTTPRRRSARIADQLHAFPGVRSSPQEPILSDIQKDRVIELLNSILESELAGVIRYTHYSFLVYGYNRIPIVSWLRERAAESQIHAQSAGEMITHLGAYPSLAIGRLLDSHQTDIGKILRESMEHEAAALALYKQLLAAVEGRSVMLEEYARQMIYAEELHAGEVDKMLRKPGEIGTSGLGPAPL